MSIIKDIIKISLYKLYVGLTKCLLIYQVCNVLRGMQVTVIIKAHGAYYNLIHLLDKTVVV